MSDDRQFRYLLKTKNCHRSSRLENRLTKARVPQGNLNLTAVGYNLCVMVIATAFGAVPLAVGVAAHEGSTLIVCLNSLRLLFGKNS